MRFEENVNHFRGEMTPNALDKLDPNMTIKIEQGIFVPNDPPGSYIIQNMAKYNGVLLSVHYFTRDWNTVEGSAVLVAPGVAITTAHVMDEDLIALIMKGDLQAFCIGLTASGPRFWNIREICKVGQTDLLILSLSYSSPIPANQCFPHATITTRLPQIGEIVTIVGFRADGGVRFPNFDAIANPYFPTHDENHIEYGAKIMIGVGEVTQHHIQGRGAMARGPAIEVACATQGGMSGGPVFDKNGMLIGVLSAAVDHEDGAGHSQVSLVVPALVRTINPSFAHLYNGPIRLLNLNPELFHIDGRDAISFTEDTVSGDIRLDIESW
jgi:hypothetical protein